MLSFSHAFKHCLTWGPSADEMVNGIKRGLVVRRFSGYVKPEDGIASGSLKRSLVENRWVKYPSRDDNLKEPLRAA